MRLRKSKTQQGIRTKSDYVPAALPEASSIAQKAAALTFKNQQSPSVPTSTRPTTIVKKKPLASQPSSRSPPKLPTQRFSIHSYATNKRISISSNNKVTSEPSVSPPPLNLTLPSTSQNTKRHSISSSINKPSLTQRRSVVGTLSQQDSNQVSSPSAAAMAALNIVAKANPKSMIAPDFKLYHSDDAHNLLQSALSPVQPKQVSRSGSVISRQLTHSSDVSINQNQNQNSPYQLNASRNSHSSLPMYSSDNRSSRSLISSKELQRALTSPSSSSVVKKQPLQTEVISEVKEEHAPAGLGTDLLSTPYNKNNSRSDNSVVFDPLKNSSSNSLLFNNDRNNEASNELESPLTMTNGNHPYLALLNTGNTPKEPLSPRLFNDAFKNTTTNQRNQSVTSNFSHNSEDSKFKTTTLKKQNEEFLYQSPLAMMKRGNSMQNNNSDSVSILSETTQQQQQQQQQQPKRKPPPPAFEKGSLLLPPPLPQNSKRLSLSSDFDVESSPQLSAISFNSSNDDFKSKKTRKPPPALSPLDTPLNDLNSYFASNDTSTTLQPPGAVGDNKLYDSLSRSVSTFDEEGDLSSVNDSTILNESTSALPKYPTYTANASLHHHHPHIPMNKIKNNARALFGRSKSSQQQLLKDKKQQQQQVYYVGTSDHSSANLNPATISQTAILVPQHKVRLKTTMRKDKKGKEFNVDKPWKHHNDIDTISEQERKRYEGVWVANKDLCMDLALKPDDMNTTIGTEDATTLAKTAAASLKLSGHSTQLMHRIIVREIFKRSRLPPETLRRVYNLVDHHQDGFLRKDEFVVGMWLIDQCLYGRKLPKQVSDAVWDSVHNTGVVGVNITIGKKKKK